MIKILVILALLTYSALGGSTFYISPNGSDSNDGQSSAPWKSFEKAFNSIIGGDELVLMDGTYSEGAGTGLITWDGTASAQPPSGTAAAPTIVRAQHSGNVFVDGGMFIGRSARKDKYIIIQGITFIGDSEIYNCDYCTVKDCGFNGSFWIGTNDHQDDNQYNLVEDCWIWGTNRRVISGNYRANHNVWRRVVVRGDGCDISNECMGSGNPNVGFTVYDSHDCSIENVMVVDRVLAQGAEPYADFAAAQHTDDVTWYNGRNKWLGCISVKSPDAGFYLEPDNILDPTFTVINSIAFNPADTGFNIARMGSNILYHGLTSFNATFDGVRVASDDAITSGTVRNIVSYGSGRYGINSKFTPSYVNVFGSGESDFNQQTATVGVTNTDPTKSSPVALKYIVRIEDGSFLKGSGFEGGDIGANIVYRYGADGSRYGDSDYEALTSTPLWPWPNEDRIKAEMCQSVTRGFCSSGKQLDGVNKITLTSYIWELMGNQMPAQVYQYQPSAAVPTNSPSSSNRPSSSTPIASDSISIAPLSSGLIIVGFVLLEIL